MTFANEIWLYLTPAAMLFAAALLAHGLRKRSELLRRFAAPRLLDQLTEKAGLTRLLLKSALIALAFGAIAFALARPQYGVEWTERKARGLDLVFALDASKSMLARDLRPDRLTRAKLAVLDVVDRLESDRIGLVVFAGRAFLQTPPTLDYGAFRQSLNAVDPGVLTRGGSDLGSAIREAVNAFPAEGNVKVVILLTDGEDLAGNALAAAEEAAEAGVTVHALGLGTPEGEYLRVRGDDGGENYLRDADGKPVRSRLDESTLRQVASRTGGTYARLSPAAVERLAGEVLAALPRTERESELKEVRIERFQWALGFALACLLLESLIRRRGRSALAALAFAAAVVQTPTPLRARDPASDAVEPPGARALYNDALETIRGGNYEGALDDLKAAVERTEDRAIERDALYNMAHATYQIGQKAFENGDFKAAIEQWKEAEALFASAREIDPADPDAPADRKAVEARRKALEKFLENRKKQEQQQQQQPQQDGQQPQQDQSQQGDSQQGDSQQGDSQQNQSEASGGQQSQSSQQDQSGSGQSESQQSTSPENTSEEGESKSRPEPSGSGEQPSEGSQDTSQESEPPQGSEAGDPRDRTDSEDDGNTGSPGQDREEEQDSQQPAPQQSDPDDGQDPSDESAQTGGQREDPVGDSDPIASAGSSRPVPEVPENGESGEDAASDAAARGAGRTVIRGMTEQDARRLLDSLRGKEQLLPYVEPSESGDRGDRSRLRDW